MLYDTENYYHVLHYHPAIIIMSETDTISVTDL